MIGDFFHGKKIFITGHTGFKGSWLCLWLTKMGAKVTGYALEPPTSPSLFELCKINELITSIHGDVRDQQKLLASMQAASPDVVIHMAAQPLVRDSYQLPVETYNINVMGTVHLMEAIRQVPGIKAVINITTDKVYENKEWAWGYRENEPLGGYDPYSSSKACSELVTSAYRQSYFSPQQYPEHGVAVASARAGNVIGGGDWDRDRLVPDCIRAFNAGETIMIRNPVAVRPWQYVLEPLYGYLLLAQKLYENGTDYATGWNFGPYEFDAKPVEWIVRNLCTLWGEKAGYKVEQKLGQPHEANWLKLDCSKARGELGWMPVWSLDTALGKTVEWARAHQAGNDLRDMCLRQCDEYIEALSLNDNGRQGGS